MIEIIPAILEKSFSQVRVKIRRIEQEAPTLHWVQLDIMDGKFVPNVSWSKLEDLSTLQTALNLEVHLMVVDPLNYITRCLSQYQIKRILIHRETVTDEILGQIIANIKKHNREIGMVLNPSSSLDSVKDHLIIIDEVMFMGVDPGFSGKSFKAEILTKIKDFKKMNSKIPIAIDGGVNSETAPKLISAGASRLCAASWLWKSQNLQEAINILKLTVIEL